MQMEFPMINGKEMKMNNSEYILVIDGQDTTVTYENDPELFMDLEMMFHEVEKSAKAENPR